MHSMVVVLTIKLQGAEIVLRLTHLYREPWVQILVGYLVFTVLSKIDPVSLLMCANYEKVLELLYLVTVLVTQKSIFPRLC